MQAVALGPDASMPDAPIPDGPMPHGRMDAYLTYLDSLDRAFLHPLARDGFRHWRGLLLGRRFPTRADVDPTAIPHNLAQISVIDVACKDPLRFRLRLLGHHNRLQQGVGPGDDIAKVLPSQGRDRILARLRLCVEEARPIRGVYRYVPLKSQGAPIWAEVASCPLSDDQETVSHIISYGADFDVPPTGVTAEWP